MKTLTIILFIGYFLFIVSLVSTNIYLLALSELIIIPTFIYGMIKKRKNKFV